MLRRALQAAPVLRLDSARRNKLHVLYRSRRKVQREIQGVAALSGAEFADALGLAERDDVREDHEFMGRGAQAAR